MPFDDPRLKNLLSAQFRKRKPYLQRITGLLSFNDFKPDRIWWSVLPLHSINSGSGCACGQTRIPRFELTPPRARRAAGDKQIQARRAPTCSAEYTRLVRPISGCTHCCRLSSF